MRQHGVDVRWYLTCTNTNAWASKKQSLKSIEWTNTFKMSMNCGTGSRSEGNYHFRYQVCGENKIIESLPCICGTCPKMELLRNVSHHKTRSTLVNLPVQKKLEVYEEIHC